MTRSFEYLYLGGPLGGRLRGKVIDPDDRADAYKNMARRPEYVEGIDRVLSLAADPEAVVCLMCAEEDPVECHRRRLVGRTLVERGVRLEHLRKDGELEEEAAVEDRFLARHPEQIQGALFQT